MRYTASKFEAEIKNSLSAEAKEFKFNMNIALNTAMKVAEMFAKNLDLIKVSKVKGSKSNFAVKINALNYVQAKRNFGKLSQELAKKTDWVPTSVEEFPGGKYQMEYKYNGKEAS